MEVYIKIDDLISMYCKYRTILHLHSITFNYICKDISEINLTKLHNSTILRHA